MNEINFNIEDMEKINLSMDVGVKEIHPPIEDLEVTPTKEEQIFTHENSYGYDKVTIKPMPEIKLQDKEVTPTKETQNIVADNNYDGLNQVTVNPIPEEYIIPEGMLPITENTTYDVRRYARVSASVHPAPNLQDKSITITENGTQNITADSGYDGLGNVEVITNIENVVEPEVEPDYIQDGLIAWWEGCDDVDSNGRWCSRVGSDYIRTAPETSSSMYYYPPYSNFNIIKSEKAYQNNMTYGLVTNEDYYKTGYTIEFVGVAKNGANNALYNTNVSAPLLAFDKGDTAMIGVMGTNGYFTCINKNQESGLPKKFTNCYGKRYKYAITLDEIVPRGSYSGYNTVSYSLNDSQWYQKSRTSHNNTYDNGNRMTILCYYWNNYKSNSEVNSIRVYNRRLTEEELKHNYEIDKARFNLDEYN